MAGRKSKLTPALHTDKEHVGAGQEIAQAWDRRAGESTRAFEAFVLYRNMGVQRSISQVSQNLSKTIPALKEWSLKYEWVKRAEAWDEHQIKQMDATRDEQRKRLVERELVDYERMLTKFDDVWDSTKLHLRHVRKKLEDGSTLEIVELNVDDWHKLTKWRDDISKQGRRALGLPDKITESKQDLTSGGEPLTGLIINIPPYDDD